MNPSMHCDAATKSFLFLCCVSRLFSLPSSGSDHFKDSFFGAWIGSLSLQRQMLCSQKHRAWQLNKQSLDWSRPGVCCIVWCFLRWHWGSMTVCFCLRCPPWVPIHPSLFLPFCSSFHLMPSSFCTDCQANIPLNDSSSNTSRLVNSLHSQQGGSVFVFGRRSWTQRLWSRFLDAWWMCCLGQQPVQPSLTAFRVIRNVIYWFSHFCRVTQNDFKSNVFLLEVCFVPAPRLFIR